MVLFMCLLHMGVNFSSLNSPSTSFLFSTSHKILPRSIANAVSDVQQVPNISLNPLKVLRRETLIPWMKSKKKEALKYSTVRGEGDLSDSDASEQAVDSDASDE